jgi:hypothetical protein
MQLASSRKRWMQCSESRLRVGAHSGAMGAATYKMGAGGVNREARERGGRGERRGIAGEQKQCAGEQESRSNEWSQEARLDNDAYERADYAEEAVPEPTKGPTLALRSCPPLTQAAYFCCEGRLWLASRRPFVWDRAIGGARALIAWFGRGTGTVRRGILRSMTQSSRVPAGTQAIALAAATGSGRMAANGSAWWLAAMTVSLNCTIDFILTITQQSQGDQSSSSTFE